ncbi:hypothetical protein E2C01_046699 [Portunus trituberculatus]|uniref:Uncharacterized protein n=1 Tax=Portunus trituberculatus TaxID=210409 RepID=A0A5B7FYI3_PORTR|nr:hypothetical protein [Portunus trituberculatus]
MNRHARPRRPPTSPARARCGRGAASCPRRAMHTSRCFRRIHTTFCHSWKSCVMIEPSARCGEDTAARRDGTPRGRVGLGGAGHGTGGLGGREGGGVQRKFEDRRRKLTGGSGRGGRRLRVSPRMEIYSACLRGVPWAAGTFTSAAAAATTLTLLTVHAMGGVRGACGGDG